MPDTVPALYFMVLSCLYCTVMCSTVLLYCLLMYCCIVFYCTVVLCSTVLLYCVLIYCTALHCSVVSPTGMAGPCVSTVSATDDPVFRKQDFYVRAAPGEIPLPVR